MFLTGLMNHFNMLQSKRNTLSWLAL